MIISNFQSVPAFYQSFFSIQSKVIKKLFKMEKKKKILAFLQTLHLSSFIGISKKAPRKILLFLISKLCELVVTA